MDFRMAEQAPKQDQVPESKVKYSVHFLNTIRIIVSPDESVPIHHCYSDYIRIWNRFCCVVLILIWLCCSGCLECLLSLPSASFLPHLCRSQWPGIYHIMNNNTSYAVSWAGSERQHTPQSNTLKVRSSRSLMWDQSSSLADWRPASCFVSTGRCACVARWSRKLPLQVELMGFCVRSSKWRESLFDGQLLIGYKGDLL